MCEVNRAQIVGAPLNLNTVTGQPGLFPVGHQVQVNASVVNQGIQASTVEAIVPPGKLVYRGGLGQIQWVAVYFARLIVLSISLRIVLRNARVEIGYHIPGSAPCSNNNGRSPTG